MLYTLQYFPLLFKHISAKAAWLASTILLVLCTLLSNAAALEVSTSPEKAYTMEQRLTHKDISQILNLPYPLPAFKPGRTVEELKAACTTWAIPPAPNEDVKNWYRAATTLDAIKLRTVEQHQQMLQLYEAAARKGHYDAVKNLTIWYTKGGLVLGARFMPDPDKARYWLDQAIKKHQWTGALEWVPHIMGSDGSGFNKGQDYKQAYLQAAADKGVALAQFQLALVYGNKLRQVEKEKALLECAAKQGLSVALKEFATYREINEAPQEALALYQQAVMNGNEAGGKAAYILASAFREGGRNQKVLHTPTDLIRKEAYMNLDDALRDGEKVKVNPFYRFPRLNEVLPLPPAAVTEWKGIYSAMSEDDAIYYQNPPTAEFYLKQVEQAGLLVPLEYISQPYYPKEGESLF